MKNKHLVTLIILTTLLLISSCVTRKKMTYLQYSGASDLPVRSSGASVTPSAYKIQPYDNLYIRVVTPDPQWSELFNPMPAGAGGMVTEASAALFGYPVDNDGYIDIPFVGKQQVEGKSLNEIKNQLETVFKSYVSDAAITVRLVNNFVSVIGEVTMPGRYPLTKERINVFEALSMAGDMSEFANRQEVQLIRPTPYGPEIKEFTLRDRSILQTEYFYIMPNDIIYVKPMRGRTFGMNSAVISTILSSVTTFLVIWGFFR